MKHQPSQHCQRSTPTLHIDVSPLAAIPKTHAPHMTHRDYGSAVYHCFVTATTVGYGDTSITTAEGQARAAALTQPLSRDGNSSLLPSTTFHPRLLASYPPTLLPSYPPTLLSSSPSRLLASSPQGWATVHILLSVTLLGDVLASFGVLRAELQEAKKYYATPHIAHLP